MNMPLRAFVGVFALLTACGPTEDVQPSNELFDAAVQEMTTAYFYHVPEAATQLGISEDTVPGTGHRMMDRSVDGNAARGSARRFEVH